MVERRRRGGRKPIAHEAATCWIHVRVTEQTKAALRDVARVNLTNPAAFVREAIESAVADCSERPRVFARSA